MLELTDIKETNLTNEEVQLQIDTFNNFYYNPEDSMVFGYFLSIKNLTENIKSEGRFLNYEYNYYYNQYLEIDFLLTFLESNKLKDIKEDLYCILSKINFFFPNKSLSIIYEKFDKIIEIFTDREKEILQSYKKSPRLFKIQYNEYPLEKNLVDEFWIIYLNNFVTTHEFLSLLRYNKKKYETFLSNKIMIIDKPNWIIDYKNKIFSFSASDTLQNIFNLNDIEKKILNVLFAEYHLNTATSIIIKSPSIFPLHINLGLIYLLKMRMPFIYNIDEIDLHNFFNKPIWKNQFFLKDTIHSNYYCSLRQIDGSNGFLNSKIHNLTPQEIINKYIPFIYNDNALDLTSFTHLEQDVSNIIKALQQNQPKDILIWGPPGFGKTQLVKSINKYLNFNIVEVNKNKVNTEARFNIIDSSKNINTLINNYTILIDEAEDILKGKESKSLITRELENKKVHTFWIINDLEDIPEAYLRRFDFILEISEMPFDLRKSLAVNFLNGKDTDNLSYKIAQAIHTPAEIKSVIDWCHITNNYSWANISNKIVNYQKALAKSLKSELGNFNIEVIHPEQNKSLDDFAGYNYIKNEAKEILDIFTNPEKYKQIGSKVPKGILLTGEPGVGKTMFTKCLASELCTTLITADSSALAEKPERIKLLFEKAKSQAPCIVFIDEIDVLASDVIKSSGDIDTGKQKILNQLLTEIDGFHSFSGIMVIGATHRFNILDKAITRSERFGKTIYFRSPSHADRKEIIKHYCDKIKIDNDINYHQLAKLSASFTSADISMAVNEASLIAVRNNRLKVSNHDLIKSINQVFFGTSLNGLPLTTTQKWKTAVHEAGHALVAIKIGQTPQRISIKPHLNFLGVVNLEEKEGIYGSTWTQIKQKIQIFLGGMVAEEIIFSEHSQGVESDLSTINNFINDAIKKSGMSSSLGSMTVGYMENLSLTLMEQIEKEKRQIINEAKDITLAWLKEHKKELVDFAKLLYEERSLDDETMKTWFNKNILKKDELLENDDIESLLESAYKT